MQTNLISLQQLFFLPVRYEVPEFQRRYVWNEERQWEPLWADVIDIAERILQDSSTKDKHFLGAVVLQPETSTGSMSSVVVIDGQQRITTLQLMMDAVQEVISNSAHKDESEKLKTLIENPRAFTGNKPDFKFKVWPTVFDQNAFRCAMHDELDSINYAKSLVVQAHEFFKTQTQNWLDAQLSREIESDKIANAIGQAIRQHLQLVVIDLGEEDPHLIFETMNARGTPLLQSDMVKNSIIHLEAKEQSNRSSEVGGEQQQIKLWPFDEISNGYWPQEIGRGFNRRPRIDVFLNYWLTFRNRAITPQYREFETFRRFTKAHLKNRTSSIYEIAKELSDIGDLYQEIDRCTIKGIEQFLYRCKVMNLGVVTPLLFWLLTNEHLKQRQTLLINCIRILDSYFVRRAVCGLTARYTNIFEQLLRHLNEVVDHPDQALRDFLVEQTALGVHWPSDDQFKKRFLEDPVYQWISQGRLRMVLLAIEEQLRSHPYSEKTSVSNAGNLQIEHVMPISWNKHWPLPVPEGQIESLDTIKEQRDRIIHTVGNLTLVNPPFNPFLSNKEWSEKKKAIEKHSALLLNKELIKNDNWDEEKIRERSDWVFEQARRIWPHANQILV